MSSIWKSFQPGPLEIACFLMLLIVREYEAELTVKKTSFSCTGRPAGYYADVESGCQVYHMCDGLGRQFSYSCPNTTLFQQRMLICDHWYMVNCSKAESNYAANLLIGQRDKPFVNDEENNLRTPRPDLLDRPYAPDYSGESFRNQYKRLGSTPNRIHEDSKKMLFKNDLQLAQNSQTRWRIPPPSRTILPPAFEPQAELSSNNVRPKSTTSTQRPTSLSSVLPRKHTEALYQRVEELETDDLGTSHSTRYNTSTDLNAAALSLTKDSTKLLKFIKPPSKIYEPPFVHPIYNQDTPNEVQTIPETLRISPAAPFSPAPPTQARFATGTVSTTSRPFNRPTTNAGQPFSRPMLVSTAKTTINPRPTLDHTEYRTPTPAQAFRQSTRTSTVVPKNELMVEKPVNNLLPPFVEFVPHDIATTQGPPIYYEWKVPANGLVPPKLDEPISADGRENIGEKESFSAKKNSLGIPHTVLSAAPVTVPKRLPSSRSTKPNAQLSTEKAERRADVVTSSASISSLQTDITQLRKHLLIPEFAFPLETIGRTGYAPSSGIAGDLYNSFQLKIPDQRLSSSSSKTIQGRWFGENPKCPECHPSFVLPGTCEPCLRR